MPKYEADFYALAPIWGTIPLEDVDFVDESQFEYDAENYVKDNYSEATNIDIRNIREIV